MDDRGGRGVIKIMIVIEKGIEVIDIARFISKMEVVGVSIGDANSVYGHPEFGPVFGNGNDLGFNGSYGKWFRNRSYSYFDVGIPEYRFSADDYEVFQVIKK